MPQHLTQPLFPLTNQTPPVTKPAISMQAIITKYIAATNTKPSLIKAACERGSITSSWDHGLGVAENHFAVADLLVSKFIGEDVAKYGTPPTMNPWGKTRAMGQIPSGAYVHVFTS